MTRARRWGMLAGCYLSAALVALGCKAPLTDAQIDALAPDERAAALEESDNQTRALEGVGGAVQTIGAILPQPWGLILSAVGVGVASIAADRKIRRRKTSKNPNSEN